MQSFELLGYTAGACTLTAFSMKRMIPLRIAGLGANCFFIAYGLLGPVYPALVLHAVLLPLNSWRLYQMIRLVQKVRIASRGDLNMDWLKPFMSKRDVSANEVIFRKGDLSSAMYYTVTGAISPC
jgi:CRP/FNR family cyclic AMP-dependent transcriptional regulator